MSNTKYTHRRSTAWTPTQWAMVQQYADRTGMSPSTVIRVLVMQALGENPSAGVLDLLDEKTVAQRISMATEEAIVDCDESEITHNTLSVSFEAIAKAFVAQNRWIIESPLMDDDYRPESD